MALDKVAEILSALPHPARSRLDVEDLERLSAEVRELIRDGAASNNATAAQKFDFGDRITLLLAISRRAEENAALTEDGRAFLELCRNRLHDLLDGNQVSRSTLVNYGKIARVFGPDHVIRKGSLPFSIAKTLSSLENADDRDHWYGQALLRKMSISQLQAELSSRRGPASDITDRRKQSRAFVCAQTGQAITEDNLKAMVVVHLPSPVGPALQEPVKVRGKGRAATKASSGFTAASPKLLRFRDVTALAAWSEAHKGEYPEAGLTPALPDSARSTERTTNPKQRAASASNVPASEVDASTVENP